jgi:regulator of sigma E protease
MAVLADLGGLAWTIGSFLVALGVIVAVHEYGHYIVGRWSGIKADVFSLGFGPVVASRVDRRGTRWQVALIPLGGFVKFKGDQDAASVGSTGLEGRDTMAGAPLWARAATVAAGPIFNFVLAFGIFLAVILISGLPQDRPIVGVAHPMPNATLLQQGDLILAMNDQSTPDFKSYLELASKLPATPTVSYHIQRGDQTLDVVSAHPMPALIGAVYPKNAGMAAGIQVGDVILSVNGQTVSAFAELPPVVEASKGAPMDLIIWRTDEGSGGQEISLTLTPNRRDLPKEDGSFETRWLIGLSSGLLFDPQTRQAGPIEAAQMAAAQVWSVLSGSLSGIVHLVRGDISSCNLSGPVGLAGAMGDAARSGLSTFVSMLAVVSLGVGLLNLFPIPVLDGGHLVFFAYEAVTGRKPNPKVLNVAVAIGLALILALTVFALGNDLTCR